MNVTDVVTRVERLFGDEAGVQLTEADVIRWINDAQREIVMHNESVLETTSSVDLVVDQDEYTFPTDLYILRSLRYKYTDDLSFNRLQYMNLQEFDSYIAGWDGTFNSSARPLVYTTYEEKIFLYPRPSESSTGGLKILYSKKPTEITTASDPLTLPVIYHNAIVKYCYMMAQEMDEEYEASANALVKFQGDVNALSFKEKHGSDEYYPFMTVRPEDAW